MLDLMLYHIFVSIAYVLYFILLVIFKPIQFIMKCIKKFKKK